MSERALFQPLGSLLLAASVSACAVGPDYQPHEPPVPAQFSGTGESTPPAMPVAEFWVGFSDPTLSALVEGALRANHDLRTALASVERSRALNRQSRRDLAPTVEAQAAYTESRLAADEAPGVPAAARETELTSADISSFWELDLFGRVRRSIEASQASLQATEAEFRALQVSIAAEVASSYFELRGLQAQLEVARRNANNQAESLQLTQARLDAGRGTDFDVARARSQLALTQSRIPALEAAERAAAHRLAVLNGQEPGALLSRLKVAAPLPALPAQVAVGTPAELLRRRPDVQAAERRLAARTAMIGVATADLFPRLSLNGVIGTASGDLGQLFSASAEHYRVGPQIGWAFLDLGRVRDRIAAADADAAGQLAAYEGTVLRALEETENALIRYQRSREETAHLHSSVQAAERASELARLRYDGGIADFLQVLDAERTQLQAEDAWAQSRTRGATALVGVYRSVAGGWSQKLPVQLSRN